MREHMGLYRGKHPNGMWVYGSLATFRNIKNEPYTAIIPVEDGENQIRKLTRVDPATVGECTTRKDKNGKLIFEGDIVKSVFNQRPYLVCFGEYTYCDEYGDELSACGFYSKDAYASATDFGSPEEWAIVIGNIHDNPELMEIEVCL